jgi:beta-lactamase regulating signal transducer with metallopeptidase domain
MERQYPMKVRFYVTVDIATDKTALSGKRSKAEEKEYAESVIADLIDVAFKGMNPTNPVVRFPRATK